MTSDLVRRLRDHVAARGGPTVENGCWSMMLEAADRLEAYEAAVAAICNEISMLVDQDIELRLANRADGAIADRLRAQIGDRRRQRQRIHTKIHSLSHALGEIRAAMPLSVRHDDPILVSTLTEPGDPDEEPEGDTGDEWFREASAVTQDAAAQPGGASGAPAAPAGHPEGYQIQAEAEAPSTP